MSRTNTKYIRRMDYDYIGSGWLVYPPVGERKYFSDKVYGGKNKTKKIAIAYRDELLEEHGLTERLNYHYNTGPRDKVPSNNTSGIVGISKNYRYVETADGFICYEQWRASGIVNGKKWLRAFSCIKHGDDVAFKMAWKARFQANGLLSVADAKKLPYPIPKKYIRQNNPTKRRKKK